MSSDGERVAVVMWTVGSTQSWTSHAVAPFIPEALLAHDKAPYLRMAAVFHVLCVCACQCANLMVPEPSRSPGRMLHPVTE